MACFSEDSLAHAPLVAHRRRLLTWRRVLCLSHDSAPCLNLMSSFKAHWKECIILGNALRASGLDRRSEIQRDCSTQKADSLIGIGDLWETPSSAEVTPTQLDPRNGSCCDVARVVQYLLGAIHGGPPTNSEMRNPLSSIACHPWTAAS